MCTLLSLTLCFVLSSISLFPSFSDRHSLSPRFHSCFDLSLPHLRDIHPHSPYLPFFLPLCFSPHSLFISLPTILICTHYLAVHYPHKQVFPFIINKQCARDRSTSERLIRTQLCHYFVTFPCCFIICLINYN